MIDRVSSDDLMSLATERDALPMQVGAIVLLDGSDGLDPAAVAARLRAGSRLVPRLGQRLVSVPWGCGRPLWIDDVDHDLSAQVEMMPCPEPRGMEGLLALAADLVCRPLPRDRPLWRAAVVTEVGAGRVAVILVHHHVLGDGVAGLAILGALADGTGPRPPEGDRLAAAHLLPSRAQLVRDVTLARVSRLARLPVSLRRLAGAVRVIRPLTLTHAAPTSLNRVTGPRRRFAVVDLDLAAVARTAHAHEVTINDVLLLMVASSLHHLLATRGEDLHEVIISMPISDRRLTDTMELGNHSGVVAVAVRTVGDPGILLRDVGTATRSTKLAPPGVSTALLAPLFRGLALLGLMRWFTSRQHLVHTFVSNLRGPESPLHLAGLRVTRVIPLSLSSGNVTVSFVALSYAGRLTLTVCADPDTCPDLAVLTDLLSLQLTALSGHDSARGQDAVAGLDPVEVGCSSRPSTPRS